MPRFDLHAHIHDFQTWDVDLALREQDRYDIETQVLSVPLMPQSPTYYRSVGSRTAREINERLAGVVAGHPDRFGAFAVIPGDEVDEAVTELTFAIDHLGLDGVCLLSNSRGRYLGDPFFESLLRCARDLSVPVLLHPVLNPQAEALTLGRPGFLLEVVFDTARTVTDALYSGVLDRLPELDLVLAHGGGSLPSVAWRIESMQDIARRPEDAPVSPEHVRSALSRLYYDVGLAGGHPGLAAVLTLAGPGQLVFGSDLGAAPHSLVEANIAALTSFGLPASEISAVEHRNGASLFKRFR